MPGIAGSGWSAQLAEPFGPKWPQMLLLRHKKKPQKSNFLTDHFSKFLVSKYVDRRISSFYKNVDGSSEIGKNSDGMATMSASATTNLLTHRPEIGSTVFTASTTASLGNAVTAWGGRMLQQQQQQQPDRPHHTFRASRSADQRVLRSSGRSNEAPKL